MQNSHHRNCNENKERKIEKHVTNLIGLLRLLFLFLALGVPQGGYADADNLPACYSLPDCRIEGVDLLTGTYSNEVTDLATGGVDPIVLRRHLSSEHPENGWQYSMSKHLYLTIDDSGNYMIHYPDGEGGMALFSSGPATKKKKGIYYCPPACTFFYNPLNSENPPLPRYPGNFSGQQRLDNVRIVLTEKGRVITAYHGDGTVRRFLPLKQTADTDYRLAFFNPKGKLVIPVMYELEQETLPSGNQRFFWCLKEENPHVGGLKLETRSSKGNFLNHLVVDKLQQQDSLAITHEDVKVNYQRHGIAASQSNILGNHFFKEVVGPNGISHRYSYDRDWRLLRKELPNDRTISISYLNDGNKISELKTPIPGNLTQGQYTISHRFSYANRQDDVHEMVALPEGRAPIRVLAENGKLLQYTPLHKSSKTRASSSESVSNIL